ncbi:MAG TPA: FmdB family zinc ribbon protein [Mycobacteriales bacterium]|nr:FmdB family zinc ribbon protein [Mycobacteriales bacterium]
MPTYQYACTECGHDLEAVQSFTDDALTVCPACDGKLRKVFSPVGVVFKGSGFYRNDSRSASKSVDPAPSSSSPASSASSSSSSSSSSTPATTPASSGASPSSKSAATS